MRVASATAETSLSERGIRGSAAAADAATSAAANGPASAPESRVARGRSEAASRIIRPLPQKEFAIAARLTGAAAAPTQDPGTSRPNVVLWLASRYENIELALAALEHVCRLRSVPEDAEHWIGMALREAVANAIKHGNRLDEGKRVLVSFGGEGDDLEIVVGDEGSGFEPGRVVDPLAPENQLKTSGRGIFYMKSFMDDVSFTRGETGGTVLRLRKRLGKTTKGAEKS